MQRRPASKERGVILLTVPLLVAVMSSLAVAIVDDIRFGMRRSVNTALRDQAYWYALGLEQFAKLVVHRSWELDADLSTLNDPWAREGARFPIENGFIDGVITDGSNCFNVNSLVPTEEGAGGQPDPVVVRRFHALLSALELTGADPVAITNGVADWIDADNAPLPRGAEDYHYTNMSPPYRTGDTLMADVSELRAVNGVTELVYRRLRPFVCALPTTREAPVNVNTLREQDAPILVMLLSGRIDLPAAEAVIAERPSAGYANMDEFWALRALEKARPQEDERPRAQTWTQYYDLAGRVAYQEAYFQLHSTFELDSAGKVRLISRAFGALD